MQELYNKTKQIMNKYNIYAKKRLGQNFLIDDNVVNKIIEYSNINQNDLIIEIGPGLGTLTEPILKTNCKLICVELDQDMIQILKDRFETYENLKVINEDILKVNLNNIIKEEKEKSKINNVKIIANLPYYITTPIIMKLLEDKLQIQDITVMVQKEVAERLTANPGSKNTGAITYAVNYYSIPTNVIKVPKTAFIPEPKVDSQVINLKLRNEPPIEVKNEENLFKIIRTAFNQRRKTLVNSLVNSNIVNKEQINNILKQTNINEKARAEELTLEQFAEISNLLESN